MADEPEQTVKLSDRQEAALLALSDRDAAVADPDRKAADGKVLTAAMSAIWRETSVAAAHQAANWLVIKGLAVKEDRVRPGGTPRVHYEITDAGRAEAQKRRAAKSSRESAVTGEPRPA